MYLFDTLKKYIAFGIRHLLPANHWYSAAYRVAGVLAFLRQPKRYQYKITLTMSRAVKLNTLLALLSRQRKPFPIPIQASGLELLHKARPNGLILCCTHMPLTKLAVNCLDQQNFPPAIAIAADPGVVDEIAIWGTANTLPAVRTGSAVLLKAKNVLQRGETVLVMVDSYMGGVYSPNMFRLAEKINSAIVFVDVILGSGGQIQVQFAESAWNDHPGANRVQEQLNELYQRTKTILDYYGHSAYLKSPLQPTTVC